MLNIYTLYYDIHFIDNVQSEFNFREDLNLVTSNSGYNLEDFHMVIAKFNLKLINGR